MKGGAKPEFLKKRVAYYLVGAEEWKYADTLESIASAAKTSYLRSNGVPGDVIHSGALDVRKQRPGAATDPWSYDPLDLQPGVAVAADEPNPRKSQSAA